MSENKLKPVPRHIKHHLPLLGEALLKRGDKPEIEIKSLPELNKKLWGIAKGELMIIGARTSQGKSSFALQIAHDVASQGHPVLYMSLEMTVLSLLERLFCNYSRIPNIDLLTGKFMQWKSQFQAFQEHMAHCKLMITENLGTTWHEIDEFVSCLDPRPKVIIIDYIQCVAGANMDNKGAIDETIRHLRQMAIEFGFTVIICSQINRLSMSDDNKEPQLHHLKGSGFLEELADKVLLLHYPFFYNDKADPAKYTLLVAKNRNGRTGRCDVIFKPEYYLFQDADHVEVVDKPTDAQAKVAELFGGKVITKDWVK